MCEAAGRYLDAVRNYEERYKLNDDALYSLCSKYPGHKKWDEVFAKCCIIGRAYATGVERIVGAEANGSMTRLVDDFLERATELTTIFKEIAGLTEPLNQDKLKRVVAAHGRLLGVLNEVTPEVNGHRRVARSFASKYLHFHQPLTPIYDERVRRAISNCRELRDDSIALEPAPPVDRDYFNYCCHFLGLYRHLQERGLKPKVKLVDALLLFLYGGRAV